VLVPGHGHRFRCGPQQRLAGTRIELQALARGPDQLGAVAVGQCLVRKDFDLARPAALEAAFDQFTVAI
jgi:hypothetical protein